MYAGDHSNIFSSEIILTDAFFVLDRIEFLGGEVDLTNKWNPRCTHVVAVNFELFHEKVRDNSSLRKWLLAGIVPDPGGSI